MTNEVKYQVIDTRRSNSLDSEHDNFNDALDSAEALAYYQARDEDIDGSTIDVYENGDNPRDEPFGDWNAGACPEDNDGGRWPYIRVER